MVLDGVAAFWSIYVRRYAATRRANVISWRQIGRTYNARNQTMKSAQANPVFQSRLLDWYQRNRRDLPWRENRDPYRIWLSEIMLQQTRVAAVMDHYRKIPPIRFPTIDNLLRAGESSVLAAWSGLGYYRRARMLHAAAKEIVEEHAGKFPRSAEDLRTLFPESAATRRRQLPALRSTNQRRSSMEMWSE